MKIGYAIKTTPKRFDPERDYFTNCLKSDPGSGREVVCYLHNDVAGQGGPSATNICIKELYDKGCDYMILMDDDTRILDDGLTDLLIHAHQVSGIHHFTFPGSPKVLIRKNYEDFILTQSQRGSGVLFFLTREVVEKVGYLNTSYPGKWGHSHIGWSIRILRAGLIPGFKGWRVSIEGIEKYFWSDDIQGHGATPTGEVIAQNFSEAEKQQFMRINRDAHNRENRSQQLYYPFQIRQIEKSEAKQLKPRVHYITPGRPDKNIGRAYNEACALIPDGDWICIRDQDSLFWPELTLEQVQEVVEGKGQEYALLGCMTNRLASNYQRPFVEDFDDMDMKHHYDRAFELHRDHYAEVTGNPRKEIAGLFMLFPKSTWNRVKFEEKNIACDTSFCRMVLQRVGNIGLLAGVYCMHWYRAQSDTPRTYKEHLINKTARV